MSLDIAATKCLPKFLNIWYKDEIKCTKSAAISLVTRTQKILYTKYHQRQSLNRYVCVSVCVRGRVFMFQENKMDNVKNIRQNVDAQPMKY